MQREMSPKIKLQFYCGHEIAMGPGKADLLEAIEREGSISGAGRAMGMSYRRAWMMVDTMNRCWREPLVATRPGHSRQGGAALTDLGRSVLADYRALLRRLSEGAQCPERDSLTRALREQPQEVSPAKR